MNDFARSLKNIGWTASHVSKMTGFPRRTVYMWAQKPTGDQNVPEKLMDFLLLCEEEILRLKRAYKFMGV